METIIAIPSEESEEVKVIETLDIPETHECILTLRTKDQVSEHSRFSVMNKKVKGSIKMLCMLYLVLSSIILLVVGLFKEDKIAEQLHQQSQNQVDAFTRLAALQGQEF